MNTCIVVPCYNEEKRLNTKAFSEFMEQNPNIHFCFVDDGSNDNTLDVLNQLKSETSNVRILKNEKNSGKAATVRNGVLAVCDDFDFVGFYDADISTSLKDLKLLTDLIHSSNYFAIFGSRVKKLGSTIDRKLRRHIFGRFFATVISILFDIKAYDTQCGAKVFKSKIAREIFNEEFKSKWIFDVELLIRSRKLDYVKDFFEQPLMHWEEVGGSKITFSDSIKIPLEIFKLYKHYK